MRKCGTVVVCFSTFYLADELLLETKSKGRPVTIAEIRRRGGYVAGRYFSHKTHGSLVHLPFRTAGELRGRKIDDNKKKVRVGLPVIREVSALTN